MTLSLRPSQLDQKKYLEQIIRVNHAGEYGAMRIYAGQKAALRPGPTADLVEEMRQQELQHLQFFQETLVQKRIRPTFLSPLWHIAGYGLGFITAKMGEKAAMACTVAVEEVIDQHYLEQEQTLQYFEDQQLLYKKIVQFRREELEHRDIGLDAGAAQAPFYKILTKSIKAGTHLAIWLSKRI